MLDLDILYQHYKGVDVLEWKPKVVMWFKQTTECTLVIKIYKVKLYFNLSKADGKTNTCL